MDLGTGKDLVEYGDIPYHLIDIRSPGSEFSVFEFLQGADRALADIRSRQRLPVVVGGTGLYLDALLKGYRMTPAPQNPDLRAELADLTLAELQTYLQRLRPQQHNRTDLENRQRLLRAIEVAVADATAPAPAAPQLTPVIFGLHWPREVLRERIRARLVERLEQGLVDEVERLLSAGVSHTALDYYGLEYRFVARHLRGELSRSEIEQQLAIAIGQFAKRQETWFRRMERQGTTIVWLDAEADPLAVALQVLGP